MAKRTSTKANEAKQPRLSVEAFQAQVEEAQTHYNEGKLTEAATSLEATLKAAPNNFSSAEKAKIWKLLGDIYVEQGTLTNAGKYYRRYLRWVREPAGRREIVNRLTEVYWQQDKFRQVVNLLEQQQQADGDDWQTVLQLHAIYAAWSDREKEAAELAEKLAQLAGEDRERWVTLGEHYYYQEDYVRAQETAQRVLSLDASDVRACCQMEECAFAQEQYEQALVWCQRAIELEADAPIHYQQMAVIYLRMEQPEAAKEALAEGVRRAIDTGQAMSAADLLCQQAGLMVQQQAWENAQSLLYWALEQVPDHLPSLQALLGVYQATEAWNDAIDLVTDRLLAHPLLESSYIHDQLGLLYLQAKQCEQALEIFRGLVQVDEAAVEPRYHLALAHKQAKQYRLAQQHVNKVLRRQRHHAGAQALYAWLSARKKQRGKKRRQERKAQSPQTPVQPFQPLKVPAFLKALDIEAEVSKVAAYLRSRYLRQRDARGVDQKISYRTILLAVVVQGIKDWTLAHLYRKLGEPEEKDLRLTLGFKADVDKLPTYQALAKRIRQMGVYPIKFLTRKLSRRSVERGYVNLDEVVLDTSLIAASCDLFRYVPDSPTGYTEPNAAWSYPKYGKRIFGFKLSLVTNGHGDILDVAVSPANVDDISLGKQAVERLSHSLAGLTIRYLLADSGYCSKSLRELVIEKLGAMPLIHFNPRNNAQKDECFTYLDDHLDWLVRKRELRQAVERAFAFLKQHYGLKNLYVRGIAAVSRYLLSRCLGAIAISLVAHHFDRPDLKARPSEVLYSY